MAELNPPLGTTTPEIFLDNVKRADELVNGPAGTVNDRAGEPLDTWRQMMAKNDEVRQNIIPLSKQYQTLEAAQADIANIPVGSTTYYRSPDDSALAIEVINNGGTLTPTGRKMPSQVALENATDPLKGPVHLLNESAGYFSEHGSASVNTASTVMQRVSDIVASGTKLLNIDSNGVLVINKIVDASPPNITLTVKNNDVEILSLTVLPGETLQAGKVESPWFLVSTLGGKTPSQVIFQESVARIIFTKEDFPD
ncbi:hypothetical protein ACYBKM_26540, partial [Klebsiella pneumoniae]